MTFDQARRRKAVARWHRRFALIIALWLIVLAVSGVLINHAHDLGLDRAPLAASLQRWVYGTERGGMDLCGGIAATGVECSGLFASLPLSEGTLLLGPDSIILLDDAGQLVEKLSASHLGLGSLQAGLRDGSRIYLRDERKTVLVDTDLMDSTALDDEEAKALGGRDWKVHSESANSISWERLLLDLHAARFLGSFARAFTDLMAVLILVLALSGVWLYRLKRKGDGNGR